MLCTKFKWPHWCFDQTSCVKKWFLNFHNIAISIFLTVTEEAEVWNVLFYSWTFSYDVNNSIVTQVGNDPRI